jgi:hypothetical protein
MKESVAASIKWISKLDRFKVKFGNIHNNESRQLTIAESEGGISNYYAWYPETI